MILPMMVGLQDPATTLTEEERKSQRKERGFQTRRDESTHCSPFVKARFVVAQLGGKKQGSASKDSQSSKEEVSTHKLMKLLVEVREATCPSTGGSCPSLARLL